MASKLLKKFKESLKFSLNPVKFVQDEAKDAGVSAKQFVTGKIQAAQKYDPGSKYLGFSGVPGVTSQKDLKARRSDAEQAAFTAQAQTQATEAAAQTAEAAAQGTAQEQQRAQLAARRRRTTLFAYGYDRANSLGGVGGGAGGGGPKTLLGY